MSALESIGIVVGIVMGTAGFVLGGLSLLHQWYVTRPHIKVRPSIGWGPEKEGYIEIVNVGQVPVMGLSTWLQYKADRHYVNDPEPGNYPWSFSLLTPQHVAVVHFKLDRLPGADEPDWVFVETVVGDTFKASRRDMRRFAKELRQPPPASP